MTSNYTVTVLQQQRECNDNKKVKDYEAISDMLNVPLPFPHGMVIDNGCTAAFLSTLEDTRVGLPLDSKRPTCDRRFLVDERRIIVSEIESIVRRGLVESSIHTNFDDNHIRAQREQRRNYSVFINKYLRILEYTTPGSELLPHCDGSKICDETGNKSTHTLLLFLKYCEEGGETLFLDGQGNWSKQTRLVIEQSQRLQHVLIDNDDKMKSFERDKKTIVLDDIPSNDQHVKIGIQPILGRILLFPHQWPHAGALCTSVPKIALRAEVTIV
jgi:hypothetical protein